MRRHLLLLAVVLAGCPEAAITTVAARPTATIAAPSDGAAFLEGSTVELLGTAGDPDTAITDLSATWLLGATEICAAAAPDADGTTRCAMTMPGEGGEIVLVVLDPDGLSGRAAIDVVATPNATPDVAITAPEPDAALYADLLVTLGGTVSDAEDAPESLAVRWESSIDGLLDVLSTVDGDGAVEAFASLSPGQHALRLYAVDTLGKEGVDSVVVTVRAGNTEPDCAILSPSDLDAFAVGEPVAFVGDVDDVDIAEGLIGIRWTSDRDGLLGTSTADSDGTVSFSTGALTADSHVVTLRATDERGAECTANVSIIVGSAPSIAIGAPLLDAIVNEGEPVLFEATVSDAESPGGQLQVAWTSNVDGVLFESLADASGLAQFATTALSPGPHVVTATVTDPTGFEAADSVAFDINVLPSAPVVSLLPALPLTADPLIASITTPAVDPEGASLSYSYAWFRNSVSSAASTSPTLPASATARGELWRVDVSASDGFGTGPAGSASVTIGNTPPVVSGVTLSPPTAYTNDVLTASPVGSDADGDTITWSYAWSIDSVPAGNDAPALDGALPGSFGRDDIVAVTVTADDGSGTGSLSASITITNSAPGAPSLAIDPPQPSVGDSLRCAVDVPAYDADLDGITYAFSWTRNGTTYAGATTTSYPGDTIPSGVPQDGDVWVCTVVPFDGRDYGPPDTASATIADTTCNSLVVAWLPGWGGSHTNGSVLWTSLLANQASYGTCSLSIVDIARNFTMSTLAATGAEVLILSDPAGGLLQYTVAEMNAVEAYVMSGAAGIVGTYAIAYPGANQGQLVDLMGIAPSTVQMATDTLASGVATVLDPGHPLASGLPSSFTMVTYLYEQSLSTTWASALLPGASIVMEGVGAENVAVAYEGPAWNGLWFSGMPEYQPANGSISERLLYNALV